jgi:hypothetical protein
VRAECLGTFDARIQQRQNEMNKPNSTTAAQQVKDEKQLRKLHEVINGIDSMCQVQLEQISSLVTVILRAMEAPSFWRDPDSLVELLGLLQYTAGDLMNFVNGAAEEVGCNYIDDVARARSSRTRDAFRKACAEETAHLDQIARHVESMEASHV